MKPLDRSQPSQWPRAAPFPLALRAGWGALSILTPGTVLRLYGSTDVGTTPRRVVRVLGVRHTVQALAEWWGGGGVRKIGTVIDGLHAATSVGFSLVDSRWRRVALRDTAVTTGFVILGLTNR